MYYGQRRGPQGQGFYSPYQKTPDWGAGIRDMLNNFRIMKQYRDEMEQREESTQLARDKYEQGITEHGDLMRLKEKTETRETREGGSALAHDIVMRNLKQKELALKEKPLHGGVVAGDIESMFGMESGAFASMPLEGQKKLSDEFLARTRPPKAATPVKPTAYDKKVKLAKVALDKGEITKEGYDWAVFGIKMTEEKDVTPGSKLTNRRIIWEKARQTAIKMQNTEGFDTGDEKTIRKHKELAGFYVDMPDKFNALSGIAETGQASPEELEYIRKGKKTWDYMHSPAMKKIKKMEDLTPSELETLDREIIKFILWNRTGKVR